MADGQLKRVLIKVASRDDWPTPMNEDRRRDYYALVTKRFVEAFDIQPETISLEPIQDEGRWRIPARGGKSAASFKFWKEESGQRKAYSAVMASLPVYMVIKFARRLNGCVGVTTPAGQSYFFMTASGGSTGESGSNP